MRSIISVALLVAVALTLQGCKLVGTVTKEFDKSMAPIIEQIAKTMATVNALEDLAGCDLNFMFAKASDSSDDQQELVTCVKTQMASNGWNQSNAQSCCGTKYGQENLPAAQSQCCVPTLMKYAKTVHESKAEIEKNCTTITSLMLNTYMPQEESSTCVAETTLAMSLRLVETSPALVCLIAAAIGSITTAAMLTRFRTQKTIQPDHYINLEG
jgi:hypothetical protein